MSKKILVHLSTNGGSSNFGDVVFADMILRYLTEKGFKTAFYDLSPYVENYLYVIKKLPKEKFSMAEADALLYFAGGYFGEPKGIRIDRHYRHYKRFMVFGREALKQNKKIAVIGIGGGPYLWKPSRDVVKKVCDRAACISTRDKETTAFIKSLCPAAEVVTASDVAQTLDLSTMINRGSAELPEGFRYVFVHTSFMVDSARKFAEGLKPFLNRNPDVMALAGGDSKADNTEALAAVREVLGDDRVIPCPYTTPDNLIAVLNRCDLVITHKLHVGIFSAALGKSVISFPRHEKIPRYYSQINQSERCISYGDASVQDIEKQVERFFGKGISLDSDIISLAEKNWQVLDRYLAEV